MSWYEQNGRWFQKFDERYDNKTSIHNQMHASTTKSSEEDIISSVLTLSRTSPWAMHKRGPGMTPGTCDVIGERAQLILV